MIIGTVLNSISFFLLGPETLIFPRNFAFVVIGLIILGIGAALVLLPSIPEFIRLGLELYPD